MYFISYVTPSLSQSLFFPSTFTLWGGSSGVGEKLFSTGTKENTKKKKEEAFKKALQTVS
jgi:hypothetical protein